MADLCNSSTSTLGLHRQHQLPQSPSSDLKDLDDDADAPLPQKADSEKFPLEGGADERDKSSLYQEAEGQENLAVAGGAATCSDGPVLERSEDKRDGQEKVEIAGGAASCLEGAVSAKSEERGSEAQMRNITALERKGERCVEEAAGARYATGLNGGVCKNQEPKPVDCEMRGAVLSKGETGVSGNEEILKRIDGEVNEESCCMKIEVIDETALVDFGKQRKATRFSENSRKDVNHKRPKRRGKCGKTNISRADENQKFLDMAVAQDCGNRNQEKGERRVYTRTELEALRFVAVEWQRKKWTEVYCGLGPAVQEEYDGLVGSDNHSQFHQQQKKKKHICVDFNRQFRNEARSSVFGAMAAKGRGCHLGVFVH